MSIFLPDGSRPDNVTPTRSDGSPKLRFETKVRKRSDGTIEKAIFIGGEKLDWSVDASSLMEAAQMGPEFFKIVQKDIENHFVESVSDFIRKQVTPEDIKDAIKTGWI